MRFRILLGLMLAASPLSLSAYVGPGMYDGWLFSDKWGGTYLCVNKSFVTISTNCSEKVSSFTNQFVRMEVTKIDQIVNPGPFRIDGVGKIEKNVALSKGPPLKLYLTVSKNVVPASHEVILQIVIENMGGTPTRIRTDDLVLTVVKRKVGEENTKGLLTARGAADGPSYVFLDACKLQDEVIPPGPAEQRFSISFMRVSSDQPFTWFIVLRKFFPPGEYEAWLLHRTNEIDGDLGVASNSTGFEVEK